MTSESPRSAFRTFGDVTDKPETEVKKTPFGVLRKIITRGHPLLRRQDAQEQEAPLFERNLSDQEAEEGREARFRCTVSGLPDPAVSWRKDGRDVTHARKYVMERDSHGSCSLVVPMVTREDEGEFACVAKNEAGKAKTSGRLKVKPQGSKMPNAFDTDITRVLSRMQAASLSAQEIDPVDAKVPRFERKITDTEAREGGRAKFRCKVTGKPPPQVTWYKNGQPISANSSKYVTIHDADGTCALLVLKVDDDDDAEYVCKATNCAGAAACSAELIVELASDGRDDTDTEEGATMRRSPISAFHPLSPRRTPLPTIAPVTVVETGYEASMDSSAAQDSDAADELIFPVILETGPFVSVQEPTDSSSLSRPDSVSSAASLNTLVIRKTSPSPSEQDRRLSPLAYRDTSDSVVSTDTLGVLGKGKGSTKSSRSASPKSRHRLSPKAFSDLDERRLVRRKSSRSGLDSPSPKQISPRLRRRYSTSSSPPFKKHLSPKTRRRSSSKSSRSPSPSPKQFSPRLMRRSLQELDSSSSDSAMTSPQRSPKLRRRSRKLSRSPSPVRRRRSPQPVTQDVEATMQALSRTNSPGHRRSPKPVVGIEVQESITGGRRSKEASRRGSLSPTTLPLLESMVTSTPIIKDGFLSPMHGLSRTTSPSEAPPVPTIGVAVAGGRRSAGSSRSGSRGISPTPSIEIEVSESKTGGRRSRASSSASSRAMSPTPSIEIEIIPRSRPSSAASSRGISPTPSLEVEVSESKTGGRRSRTSSGGASPSPSIVLDEFETVEEEPDLEKGPDLAKDPEFHFLRVPPRLSFGGHSRPSSSEYETPHEEPSESPEPTEGATEPGKLHLPRPLAGPHREGFLPSGRRNLAVQTAEFTEPLKNLSVQEGSEVRLDCRVAGLPKPTVFWFKDGSEVRPLRLGVEIRAEEDRHTLYIPVAENSHEGVYMCRTENAAGVATCSAMLHVQGAPVERSTSSGEEHVSSCISSFSPMTNTSGSSTCENLTDHTSETNSQEGWCTPEQLSDVEGSPEFIKELESLHAVQGSSVIFECEVTGSPAPTVTWYKDGQPLVEDGDHVSFESRDDGTFLLTIIDVQNLDVGTYTCRAANSVGDVVTHADLLVSVASSSRTTSVSSYKASGLDELPSGQSFESLGTSKEEELQILELLPAVGPDVLHLRRGTTPPRPGSRPDSSASSDSNPIKRLRLEHDFVSDFSETEDSTKSAEQYTVVSDYTPDDTEQDRVPLKEGQMVEVLDSSSPDLWLVRTVPSPPEPAQGWIPPSFLQTLPHSPSTRKGKSEMSGETSGDAEKKQPRRGSKEMEASSKRRFVLEELLRTEGDYVRDLKFVTDHYIDMFDSHTLPYLLRGKREIIFMNIEQIYDFHSSIFIHELGTCKNEPSKVGKIFVKWQHKFDMHVEYCKNKQRSETLLSTSAARNFFDDYTKRNDERKLTLSDFLIKPVQRITKYQLLLKELVKYTTRAKLDSTDLEHALGVMVDVPKRANDLLHISMIDGFYGNQENVGKLLRQDSFMVWDGRTTKGRGKERHIFLFTNMVLFTKRKRNSLESIEYSYKGLMRLPGIGVTEDVEGDSRKFEMWYGKPDSSERYIVQAKTIYVKQAWVKEIRDILDKHSQEAQDVKSAVEARISAMESTSSLGSSIDTPSTPTTPSSSGSRQRHVSGPSPRRRGSNVFSETSFDSLIHAAETLVVGGLYEVLETVIVDGTDELELHKGEQVKVVRSGGDDFYLVEPITDKGELAGERGWVPGYLLKKTGGKEMADDAAHFVTPLRELTHREGETATFSCQFAGTKPIVVSWFHDGVTVETGDRLSVITTAHQSSLLIGRTLPTDSGRYECVISNEAGTETSLAELDVRQNILPQLEHLDFVSAEVGDTAELWVIFTGSPTPQVRWTREDRTLNTCDKFTIVEKDDRTCLAVNDADLPDAGEYTCEVTNAAGTAVGAIRLKVEALNDELLTDDSDGFTSDSYSSSDNEMDNDASDGHQDEEPWEDEVFPPDGYKHDNNNEPQQPPTFGHSLDLLKLGHVCVQKDTQISEVYDVKDKLGQGRFGTVYLCEDKSTRRRFAAKYVRCRRSADRQSINHEIDIMNQLRHPRILQLYDAFDCGKEVAMIMELITGGELFQLVIDEAVELSEKACVSYVRQLCEAVSYMHEQNILHLDLKPENIMCISKKGTAIKLIDFGLARKFDPKEDNRVMFGTPEFVAPEVINFDSIDYSTDMWSIGVITYVLLSGLSPFMGDTDQETLANVTLAEFDFDDEAFDNISDDAKNFIEQLLLKDKENRNTAVTALQHCWLAQDNAKVRNEKIKTDKLRRWWLKRKWQKAGNAIRAVGRFRRSLGLLSGSVSEGSTSSPNGSTSTEEN
ncbi:obscurin-like [Branchiostoma floridae x Branchiostoma japonicum]